MGFNMHRNDTVAHATLDTIVLASGNAGKLLELQSILEPTNITAVAQHEFAVPDVAETGSTFVENAIIKARNACQFSGKPSLADDSGLVVDALDGKPGIYSARYSGAGATDTSNNDKLLHDLAGVPDAQRSAHFHCIIALLRYADDPTPIICQGSWEGRILSQPQGQQGFGYDPLFFVDAYDCSAAQLEASVKNRISHRARAMASLVEILLQLPAPRC
jgi:XTP/dITP diphosphohydrolase